MRLADALARNAWRSPPQAHRLRQAGSFEPNARSSSAEDGNPRALGVFGSREAICGGIVNLGKLLYFLLSFVKSSPNITFVERDRQAKRIPRREKTNATVFEILDARVEPSKTLHGARCLPKPIATPPLFCFTGRRSSPRLAFVANKTSPWDPPPYGLVLFMLEMYACRSQPPACVHPAPASWRNTQLLARASLPPYHRVLSVCGSAQGTRCFDAPAPLHVPTCPRTYKNA